MQCIIAKNDYELFYAGENISSEQPQSLTCPLCGSLGFTELSLLEHVTNEHANSDNDESSAGIICPICGSETNQLTFDFATHLTMEHRAPRDPIEQVAVRGRGGRCHARTAGPRGRRSQSHFSTVGGPAGSSPSARESNDPLVEILTQIAGVRQRPGVSNQSSASQLHQLQMQLHSSSSFSPRANEVRIMRRTFQSMSNQLNSSSTSTTTAAPNGNQEYYCSSQPFVLMDQSSLGTGAAGSVPTGPQQSALSNNSSSQYLLSKFMKPNLSDAEQQQKEVLKADRSLFVKELLLNP